MKYMNVIGLLFVVLVVLSCSSSNGAKAIGDDSDANVRDAYEEDNDCVEIDDEITDVFADADGDSDGAVFDEASDSISDESADEFPDETIDESVDARPDTAFDESTDADVSCEDSCTPGDKRCDPDNLNNVQICATDSGGCPRWTFVERCDDEHANYVCDEGNCRPDCTDACTFGERKCEGNTLKECVDGDDGCTVYKETDCTADGKQCAHLIVGAYCEEPVPEYSVGDTDSATVGVNYNNHVIKGDVFTADEDITLHHFSFYFRPKEEQKIFFMVYRYNETTTQWDMLYRSSALTVDTAVSPSFYRTSLINVLLEKDKKYAVALFFDKEIDFFYNSGVAGDIGPVEHSGVVHKTLGAAVSLPATHILFEELDNRTFPVKLYLNK